MDTEEYGVRYTKERRESRPVWREFRPGDRCRPGWRCTGAIITFKVVMIAVFWRRGGQNKQWRKLLESNFGSRDGKDGSSEARYSGGSFIPKVVIDVRYSHWCLVSTRIELRQVVKWLRAELFEMERSPEDGGIGAEKTNRHVRKISESNVGDEHHCIVMIINA